MSAWRTGSRAPGKRLAVRLISVAVIVVLLGGLFGIYYVNTSAVLAGQEQTVSDLQATVSSLSSHPTTVTSTITVTRTAATSTSQLSPSGLQLILMTNATTVQSPQRIDVAAAVYNTLAKNVTVNPNDTLYSNVPGWSGYSVGACVGIPFITLALSIAIFEGRYTPANISSATNPLLLIVPQVVPCPAAPTLESLEFQPHSDSAEAELDTFTGPQNRTMVVSLQLNSTVCGTSLNNCTSEPGINGYWTGCVQCVFGSVATNATFHNFEVGNYTVAATDSWGQTVYLYFDVV